MKFVALLRGINIGGNRKVPMIQLRNCFEELGFTEVTTLLNSGNVVFTSDNSNIPAIKKDIEAQFEKVFGFFVHFHIISQITLKNMVEINPFVKVQISDNTRLYVTFIPDSIQKQSFVIPQFESNNSFKIIKITDNAIFSTLMLSDKFSTTDGMKILENKYGSTITTRNWNTVLKLANL